MAVARRAPSSSRFRARAGFVGAVVVAAGVAAPAASAHAGSSSRAHLASAWEAPPLVLAGAALALALFAQAFVRLRRRGRTDLAPWTRVPLFAAAIVLGVLALVSPLDAAGDDYLLSAHMLQHVVIGDVAPALAVLALRGPLVFFFLPARVLRRVAVLRPLRAMLAFALRPWVALTLWAVGMLAWHVPAAYDYAATHQGIHDLEHATFVVVGTLAWVLLVDPAKHRRLRVPGRILFALGMLTLSHPIVDGMFFSSPAYPHYADRPDRLFGFSPTTDQKLAAVTMFVEQMVTLGTCIAVLGWPYVRRWRAERGTAAAGGEATGEIRTGVIR